MNWKEYYLNIAEAVKLKSKDTSTKIGVVIVGPDNEIVSTGYNSFPRGLNDNVPERMERPEKYTWVEHAERNAIYNAARIGVSTKGCTMYMTCVIPCPECAKAIIQSGITTIVVGNGDSAKGTQFNDEQRAKTRQMFKECGVKIENTIDAAAELTRLFNEECEREMNTPEYKEHMRKSIYAILDKAESRPHQYCPPL